MKKFSIYSVHTVQSYPLFFLLTCYVIHVCKSSRALNHVFYRILSTSIFILKKFNPLTSLYNGDPCIKEVMKNETVGKTNFSLGKHIFFIEASCDRNGFLKLVE
jgi:hypothetical protein